MNDGKVTALLPTLRQMRAIRRTIEKVGEGEWDVTIKTEFNDAWWLGFRLDRAMPFIEEGLPRFYEFAIWVYSNDVYEIKNGMASDDAFLREDGRN